ncbi:MAG: hypothetical protein KAQ63_03235 [Candidatus Moranbacteria bacterium]|nr:hypothetical protein [Candidatus Moranbacteria bacterium]
MNFKNKILTKIKMEDLIQKLAQQEQQLNEIHKTVKQLKRYFLTTIIVSAITFLLPVIGLVITIPWLIRTFESTFQGLL